MGEKTCYPYPERGSAVIRLINVCKSFDEKILYNKINLEIKDGEFVVFSGPSGCGKTTLLNMIGGLEPIDSGEIYIDKWNLNRRKDRMDFFKEGAGFLFQNFALVESKTTRYNMELICKKSRVDLSVEEALDDVGLIDKINTPVYKLSGGEQQRVAVARLLLKKCRVVFADEPTGSLDEKNSEIVMDLLLKLQGMGKTIIMVTHNEKYKQCADRIIEIKSLK